MTRFGARVVLVVLAGAVLTGSGLAGCDAKGPSPPGKSRETLAVEEKAGSFLDYYEQVVVLARRHAAEPDSFRAALDSLPGSHLSPEEWEAWTEPYREDPQTLRNRLEEVMAQLGR
jgi:hypothetical protein